MYSVSMAKVDVGKGTWKDVLVYTSDAPMVFEHKSVHTIVRDTDAGTVVVIVNCEDRIFKESKSADGTKYVYWFIVKSMETHISNLSADVVEERDQLRQAFNILTGLEE